MTLRRSTVEHVFGTLKYWMGSTHFLTLRLRNVGTAMSLHVLAYKLKRVVAFLGISGMRKAISSIRREAFSACFDSYCLGIPKVNGESRSQGFKTT